MKDYRNPKIKIIAEAVDLVGGWLLFWQKNKHIVPDQIKKIVILKFDRIGDTFLSLPTMEAIKKQFPKSELILFCAQWNFEVVEGNPYLDKILVLDSLPDVHRSSIWNFLGLAKINKISDNIKKIGPDLIVDLQGNPMNVLAMFSAGVKIRVGFANKILSFLLTHPAHYELDQHQSQDFFALARKIGFTNDLPLPFLNVTDEDKTIVDNLIISDHLANHVIFHLGAGRSYRQWPIKYFSQLADNILIKNEGINIVVIGEFKDQELYNNLISNLTTSDRVVSLCGKLNLKQLYHLISKARLFVGNDSGPGHFSGALDVPTVIIMNAWTTINRWRPLGKKVKVCYRKAHDCSGQFCHLIPCPNMQAVGPEDVMEQINVLLN